MGQFRSHLKSPLNLPRLHEKLFGSVYDAETFIKKEFRGEGFLFFN